MKDISIKKLYYSISEVSEMTKLKPYVLRYWESEFSQLKPSKNRAGKRIYRHTDIELIEQIRTLLYTERFTIEGARRQLKETSKATNLNENEAPAETSFDPVLKELKNGLKEILNILSEEKQNGA